MNIHPQKSRTYFGFKNWKDFDYKLFEKIYADIISQEKEAEFPFIGMEISAQTAQVAKRNIDTLIWMVKSRFVKLSKMKVPDGTGIIISNPPYDERLEEEDIEGLYYELGEKLFMISKDTKLG